MPSPARVDSIRALQEFRAALVTFADEIRQALESARGDLARASARLDSELPARWTNERRRWDEEITRAKIALEHAISQAKMGKSSVDERKALAHAKQQGTNAREKLAATKRWSREVERERILYRGQVEHLARLTDSDIPRAIARLDAMTRELDAYTKVAPPDDQHSAATTERAMAHAANPGAPVNESRYAELRALLPTPEVAPNAQRADVAPAGLAISLGRSDRAALALATGDLAPTDLRRHALVAQGEWGDTVVLQREEPADDDDSGWRIHTENTAESWVRVPCVRMLAHCPDISSVSRLPVGAAVVIRAAGVRELYDALGRDIWGTVKTPDRSQQETGE